MITLSFRWTAMTGRYQIGETLSINKIVIGGYSWNDALSKTESEEFLAAHRYKGSIHLPGYDSKRVFGSDPVTVKTTIERMVSNWFAQITGSV